MKGRIICYFMGESNILVKIEYLELCEPVTIEFSGDRPCVRGLRAASGFGMIDGPGKNQKIIHSCKSQPFHKGNDRTSTQVSLAQLFVKHV